MIITGRDIFDLILISLIVGYHFYAKKQKEKVAKIKKANQVEAGKIMQINMDKQPKKKKKSWLAGIIG